MANLKLPFNLPWFMFDIGNKQIITSRFLPSDISDTKNIVLSEMPVPGLSFDPIQSGGMGNRKISFTIPLVKRNNTVGNVLMLKQYDNLRNPSFGLKLSTMFKAKQQFTPNPKVLFYWGVGSIPLIYYVKKCDFVHKSFFVNQFGFPCYSEISMELWLDETSLIYKAEENFRKVASLLGIGQQILEYAGVLRGI